MNSSAGDKCYDDQSTFTDWDQWHVFSDSDLYEVEGFFKFGQ